MPTECPFPFAFTFSELTFMNAIHELGQLLISGVEGTTPIQPTIPAQFNPLIQPHFYLPIDLLVYGLKCLVWADKAWVAVWVEFGFHPQLTTLQNTLFIFFNVLDSQETY
jgi:hypothetical protein